MVMQSGRVVNVTDPADTTTLPTLQDIAIGLSRINRYGGQTVVPWSVLDHSFLVAHLTNTRRAATTEACLWALLHDWHEVLTGDIPSPFKTDSQRELQQVLDRRLILALADKGLPLTVEDLKLVHRMDIRAYFAEISVLMPNLLLREIERGSVQAEDVTRSVKNWGKVIADILLMSPKDKISTFEFCFYGGPAW